MREKWQILAMMAAPFAAAIVARAEDQPRRLAEYVPPSSLTETDTTGATALSGSSDAVEENVIAVFKERSEADRWMDFHEEYRIREPSSSWALSMIQLAKFQLDKLTFTAKETARKLEFKYDLGGSAVGGPRSVRERPAYSLPLFGNFDEPQLRTVLTEHDPQTASPFMGLQFNIRFGTGAPEYQ